MKKLRFFLIIVFVLFVSASLLCSYLFFFKHTEKRWYSGLPEEDVYLLLEEMIKLDEMGDNYGHIKYKSALKSWAFSHPNVPLSRAIAYVTPEDGPVADENILRSTMEHLSFLEKNFPDSPEAEGLRFRVQNEKYKLGLGPKPKERSCEEAKEWGRRMDEAGFLPFYRVYYGSFMPFYDRERMRYCGEDTEWGRTACIRDGITGVQQSVVPNILGIPLEEARQVLSWAELDIRNIEEQFSDTIPAGCIIGQSIQGGSLVVPKTTIDIVVSKGVSPENNSGETKKMVLPENSSGEGNDTGK